MRKKGFSAGAFGPNGRRLSDRISGIKIKVIDDGEECVDCSLVNPQLWPALMSPATAARYLNERNARAFRRRVRRGIYPEAAAHIEGRGEVWRKADLDKFVADPAGSGGASFDAADVL